MEWLYITLGVTTGLMTAGFLKNNIKLNFTLIDEDTIKIIDTNSYARNNLSIDQKNLIAKTTKKMGKKLDIDYLLLFAIIEKETNFEIGATGRSGEKGLMQVMNIAYREVLRVFPEIKISWEDLYNIEDNIIIGAYYFKHCLNRAKGDLKHILSNYTIEQRALMFYNGGWQYTHDGFFYSQDVLKKYEKFKGLKN